MNITLYGKRGFCKYDYIKDVEMKRLSWIIKVDHVFYKREVEEDFTTEEGDLMTSAKRFKNATAGFEDQGRNHQLRNYHKARAVAMNTVLDTGRQGNRFFSRCSGRVVLLTPSFLPHKAIACL